MWIWLTINTFSCIPLVGFDPYPEYSICGIYLLPKIHCMAKFIFLLIKIIMKITLNKYCFCYWITMRFRWKNLLDLLMNWIFLDLSETEIGWSDRPIIRTYFLLSRIIILMWFQVKFPNFLWFRHILCWINSFFDTPFISLCCKTKPEFLFICLFREAILSIDCTSERLSS